VLTNMLPTIEQHVDWIADCIDYMRERNFRRIEATPDAETAWVAEVNRIADGTLFPTCNSWYLGANIPGSRAFSCPISASRPTSRRATRSQRAAIRASR
jgi:cyclohexanone monooxygenase